MDRKIPSVRRHSFHTALLVLVLGTLSLTVAVIGIAAFVNSMRSVEELRTTQYRLMSRLIEAEVSNFLSEAPRVLRTNQSLAERGLLPVDDPGQLGLILAENLRTRTHLSWLSFGDTRARFSGAWRDDSGQIVINLSDPELNDGRPAEFVQTPDGKRKEIRRNLPAGYDPRSRRWFQDAAESDRIVWSELYLFNEGDPGLTASLAARSPGSGELLGVFTADYSLRAVDQFLASLAEGGKRILILVMPDGQMVGSASSLNETPDADVNATLAALPVPLAELAPTARVGFEFELQDMSMVAVMDRFEAAPGFSCIGIVAVDEQEFFGSILTSARITAILWVAALGLAAVISFILAGRLARPLAEISDDLARVARFDLVKRERLPSVVREIAVVGESVDRMKAGLRSFGRYVPTTLVRRLLAHGIEAEIGATERDLTIFFADLAGFTAISEKLSPAQTVEEMREYFELATEAIEGHGGTLDKFLGDGVLAFFNAPLDLPDHATHACRAVLQIRDRLAATSAKRESDKRPVLKVRFGLNTGEVLVGNIGTADRFAYTVFGDSANLAARLETLNKQYDTGILAADSVREAADSAFVWRQIDRVAVIGRTTPTTIHELLGEPGQVSDATIQLRDNYETALADYYKGNFSSARRAFEAIVSAWPGDGPSKALLARCQLLETSPPATWNAVFIAERK